MSYWRYATVNGLLDSVGRSGFDRLIDFDWLTFVLTEFSLRGWKNFKDFFPHRFSWVFFSFLRGKRQVGWKMDFSFENHIINITFDNCLREKKWTTEYRWKNCFPFLHHRLWTLSLRSTRCVTAFFLQVGRSVGCWWVHFATILHVMVYALFPVVGLVFIAVGKELSLSQRWWAWRSGIVLLHVAWRTFSFIRIDQRACRDAWWPLRPKGIDQLFGWNGFIVMWDFVHSRPSLAVVQLWACEWGGGVRSHQWVVLTTLDCSLLHFLIQISSNFAPFRFCGN